MNPKDPAYLASVFARMGLTMVVAFGVGITLTVFFLGRFGATPGKMVLRLKVVRPGGEPISYLHAAGRYLAENVSVMTLYIGYLIAAFDSERRTLHDRIAGTRVIKVTR